MGGMGSKPQWVLQLLYHQASCQHRCTSVPGPRQLISCPDLFPSCPPPLRRLLGTAGDGSLFLRSGCYALLPGSKAPLLVTAGYWDGSFRVAATGGFRLL